MISNGIDYSNRHNVMPGRGDAFAEWLSTQHPDFYGGNVESPTGWFGLYGKRIVINDDRGFIYCERHDSTDGARRRFEELETIYSDWCNDVVCTECGTEYDSEADGSCWCCGSTSRVEKGTLG